jgi:hypothetical protein
MNDMFWTKVDYLSMRHILQRDSFRSLGEIIHND